MRNKLGANRAISKIVVSIIVIAVIAIAGFVLYLNVYTRSGQTVFIPENLQTNASTINNNGLEYILSLNATELLQNQSILISMELNNTLPRTNTVTNESLWAYSWFTSSISCGNIYNAAVFKGYYTLSNISTSYPLQTDEPGASSSCSAAYVAFAHGQAQYTFKPLSVIFNWSASLPAGNNSTFNYSYSNDNSSQSLAPYRGYWNETYAQWAASCNNVTGACNTPHFIPFPPGIYTVAGGDEWGSIVLLHFVVLTSSQAPVKAVSVTGPIPPINPGGPVIRVTLENVAKTPVVSLNATLMLSTVESSVSYSFTFGVNSSDTLLPSHSVNSTRILIGAGFASSSTYPLVISGKLLNGELFNYTQMVMILPPS